jgi:hypothetical protein
MKDALASGTSVPWLKGTSYICPAGERLAYHYDEENGLRLPCQSRAIRHSCTSAKKRRITRREHEHVLEAVQRRLDEAGIELAPIRALARRDA